MATINHTEYDEMELTIQRQVDRLNHSLWASKISPEALEQKLSQRRFTPAESKRRSEAVLKSDFEVV